MEFRVLGPLEVSNADASLTVRGRIGQNLLAVLLISAGRGVSMSRLVEGVWDGVPPDTARRQVRHAASRLRKLLGPGLIESAADGYRLNVEGSTVDIGLFERAVRKSRDCASAGDTGEALSTLRSGLLLWRGSPFAGLTGRIIGAESVRLEEARLAAVEERIGLELDRGDSTQVIGELRKLLSDNPYRQRLTGLLMTALHLDARTPEAIEVYERLRLRLADNLGLDPDPVLRQRHAAILRGSAAESTAVTSNKAGAGPRATAAVPVIPAQLPADTGEFVGRFVELSALDKYLSDGTTAVSIGGIGGAGKTALALRWAHQHREDFPDGQLYINLRGFDHTEPVGAYTTARRMLTALGLPGNSIPADLDDATSLFRSVMADRRLLLVLDNARDADQVRPLLPGGKGNFAVITSRNTLTGLAALDGVALLGLRTMDVAESLTLLEILVGNMRTDAELTAARRLAELCGGLPLALRIAGANLAIRTHVNVCDYVTVLESDKSLDLLAVDGDPSAAVSSTFEHSYRALDADTQRTFVKLGLLPGEDFSVSLAENVAGLHARTHLNRLQTAHLVEQHRPGSFRFHDLVRLYAAEQSETTLGSEEQSDAIEKYIQWHYHRALMLPLDETMNIIAAIAALQSHPKVWHLASTLQSVVYAGQVPARTRQVIEAGLNQAARHDDPYGHSQMCGLLGAWYRVSGDVETALVHCRRAVSLVPDDDLMTKGMASGNLAGALISYGRYREAEEALFTAWDVAAELDIPVWHQATDYFLAILYRHLGEYDKAFDYLAEAEILRRRQSSTNAFTINRLARAQVLIAAGRFDEAESDIESVSRGIHDEADNRARCMYQSALGELAWHRGEVSGAIEAFADLRALALRTGMICEMTEASCALAIALSHSGEVDQAVGVVEALPAAVERRMGPRSEADIALAWTVTENGRGRFNAAVAHGTRAAELFGEMPSPLKLARTHVSLADANSGLGHDTAADSHRQRALAIFTELGALEPEMGSPSSSRCIPSAGLF